MNPAYFIVGGNRCAAAVCWIPQRSSQPVEEVFLAGSMRAAERQLRTAHPGAGVYSSPAADSLAEKLERFLKGERVTFKISQLNLAKCSTFQQKVLRADFCIPRGSVSTYGRVAAAAGSPQAQRAAGSALARNPFPLIIPCHRVVQGDLNLGSFQGGRPGGAELKAHLLELEGIGFNAKGTVVGAKLHFGGKG